MSALFSFALLGVWWWQEMRRRGLFIIANIKTLIYRLQTALVAKGRHISINQFQNYSEATKRMSTKYVLAERNESGKYVQLYESWRLPDIAQFLAAELESSGDASF